MLSLVFAQSATEGGGLLDLVGNPAITTPAGFALAVLLYLAKLWRDSRTERRADKDQTRTNESHIVDETKDILSTRREEAADLRKQASEDRKVINQQALQIRDLDDRMARLLRINEGLLEDNEALREMLRDGIGPRIETRAARRTYDEWRRSGNGTDSPTDPNRPLPGPDPAGGTHRRGAGGSA